MQKSFPDLLWRTKCKLKTYSEENQPTNPQEQLVQLIRVQYGISEEGLLGLQNLFDTFSRLEDAISEDSDSVPDDELNESLSHEEELVDSDDSNDSYNDYTLPVLQGPLSDETTKRKSPEAGCSEPNRTTEETENSKRMKLNSSSSKNSVNEASTSAQSDTSDAWETTSNTSNTSRSSLLSETSLLSTDANFHNFFKNYESAHCSSNTNNKEVSSDLNDYKFVIDCKENKLSKLLKDKIDSLPIPVPLKNFLNYYRVD